MRAIIVTKERFDELNKLAQDYLSKNVKGYVASRWANPIVHTDGRIAFPVKDRILPILQGETIVELADDWFPKNEL